MIESKAFGSYFKEYGAEVTHLSATLLDNLLEGNTCIKLLDFYDQKTINKLLKTGIIGTKLTDRLPIFFENDKAYIFRYYKYETDVVQFISQRTFFDLSKKDFLMSQRQLLRDLFAANPNEIDWQLIACLSSFIYQFSIITGGPGTGKTTTVAKLLVLLLSENKDLKIALLAPTGKAAAKLAQSIEKSRKDFLSILGSLDVNFNNIETSTIHRFLGYLPNSIHFKYNAENPLPYDVIIVDECSMVDLPLMSKLLVAIKKGTKVVFMGDKKQLSSVDVGSVFGDICDAKGAVINTFTSEFGNWLEKELGYSFSADNYESLLSNKVVELQKSWRFNDYSGLGKFSNEILKESVNCEDYREERGDEFVKIDNQGLSKSFFSFVERYRFYIQEKDTALALQKLDLLRVLCSTRTGKLGVEALNQVIELFLKDNFELKPENGFYHNQPIMITQNNTGLKLFNGDVGLVRNDSSNELLAYFIIDSKLESIPVALIKDYQTVFAMTIHKSQGSEFESVVVIIPDNTEKMKVSKELLYTAVTRAKKQVLLLASDKAIDDAIHFSVKRTSGLKERLTT